MQFEFLFKPRTPGQPEEQTVRVSGRDLPVRLVRHRRARRYVLRLCRDGAARVTIPRGGSAGEAKAFVARQIPWLEKQLLRQATLPRSPRQWKAGSEILLRGEPIRLQTLSEAPGILRFGSEQLRLVDRSGDLRPAVERHLWKLARYELGSRVMQLAALHGCNVQRVTIRNQRSRWGSCSRKGTISLNWRLIQTPAFVSDYIILHELAHLKHMNHSQRFWREVARLCPNFQKAERWLKTNRELLR
ncbi:MAG TPA: SprT family zinc-dependent metalloprotease [Candidatus Dormibacteraeota bacterium]|nr:SprT family zinc-dependent metalloprotease [Candidatus Dormibacteraeota bacterium]